MYIYINLWLPVDLIWTSKVHVMFCHVTTIHILNTLKTVPYCFNLSADEIFLTQLFFFGLYCFGGIMTSTQRTNLLIFPLTLKHEILSKMPLSRPNMMHLLPNNPLHLWNAPNRCFGAFHNLPRLLLPLPYLVGKVLLPSNSHSHLQKSVNLIR